MFDALLIIMKLFFQDIGEEENFQDGKHDK